MEFPPLPEDDPFPSFEGKLPPVIEEIKKPHILWRGVRVVVMFFVETPLAVLALAIAAFVCQLLCPVFAMPLFVIMASTLLSKLVVKVLSRLKSRFVEKIERGAWNFKCKFPKLRLIAFIFTMALSYIVPIAGIAMGAALGCFNGLIIEVEHCKNKLNLNKRECREFFSDELNIITT